MMMTDLDRLSRIALSEAAGFFRRQFKGVEDADVVIQFGSGQSPDGLFDEEFARADLHLMPGLPSEASLAKHDLVAIWGRVGERRVLVLRGRYHYYEGYGRHPSTLPIWAVGSLGPRNFVFCNAAGAVNPSLSPGSFMLIRDHINNLGVSALSGHHHLLKTAFVDMRDCYGQQIRESIQSSARDLDMHLGEGVYMANTGPNYETPAEVQAARVMGADALGMSTVLEATVAHALGARVGGICMITNYACGISSQRITHDDTWKVGNNASEKLIALLRNWVINWTADILHSPQPGAVALNTD